jgi:hypothetical protein
MNKKRGIFWFFIMYNTVSSAAPQIPVSLDAGIEPRTVATTALTVRRSNHSAKSHPQIEVEQKSLEKTNTLYVKYDNKKQKTVAIFS